MLSAVLALLEANDDVLDAMLLVAIALFLVAAFSHREASWPASIGYLGLAFMSFGLMFVTGP
jgi:hypothetical protein